MCCCCVWGFLSFLPICFSSPNFSWQPSVCCECEGGRAQRAELDVNIPPTTRLVSRTDLQAVCWWYDPHFKTLCFFVSLSKRCLVAPDSIFACLSSSVTVKPVAHDCLSQRFSTLEVGLAGGGSMQLQWVDVNQYYTSYHSLNVYEFRDTVVTGNYTVCLRARN